MFSWFTARAHLWTVALLGLAMACGGSQKPKAEAGFSSMTWNEAEATKAPTTPPATNSALATGEHLTWRFSLFGIELGRLALAVGEPGAMEGREVVIVRAQVETTKMAAIFAPVQQQLTTFVDMKTLQPVYQRREVEKGTEYKWVEVKLATDAFTVNYRTRASEEDSKGEQKLSDPLPLFDSNSLFLAARTWNTKQGDRMVVNVFREIYVWQMQIEHAGAETIKTSLGEFPAIRYDCIGRRLQRDGTFDTSMEPRSYSFWISDDHKRLPLSVLAKTDYGDARMELIEHGKVATP